MSDLDLSALRKVAEAATPGPWARTYDEAYRGNFKFGALVFDAYRVSDQHHLATFAPETVLALLDELERARSTIAEADQQFEKGYWQGANEQWQHRPLGNRIPQSQNPYRQVSDG